MKIGFLITARLKSSRLKLKILRPLAGKPVIEHVINRARSVVECDDIVLCTSTLNQDLPLVRIAAERGIYAFNGHPDDVLDRLTSCANLYGFDYVICITADNPLFSTFHASLLSDYIRQHPEVDFVTTTGMPIGVNIYAIKVKALNTICASKQEIDTEIWFPFIHEKLFNIVELPVEDTYTCKQVQRLTLDEPADYELLRQIYNAIPAEVPDILDVYQFLRQNPEIAQINQHVRQFSLSEEHIRKIRTHVEENQESILGLKNKIYNETVSSSTSGSAWN